MTIRRPVPSARPSPRLARWRAAVRQDEGSGPIGMAIVFPVMLAMVFVVVQLAMDYWVHAVALTAAREGAHAGAAYGKTTADGLALTQSELARLGGNSITNLHVTPDGSDRTQVQINVSGNAVSLWPFGPGPTFHVTVIVPVERLTDGANK